MYKIDYIHTALLKPGHQQVRQYFDPVLLEELKNSIQSYGLLQPVIVQEKQDHFMIVAGERRFRACKELGMQQIPCYVLSSDTDTVLEVCLIENLHRADLNPIEEAQGYEKMSHAGLTQQQIADKIGKSRSYIANMLRLLTLPADVREKIQKGELSAGHGNILLQSENPESLMKQVVDEKMSVQKLKTIVKQVAENDTMQAKTANDVLNEMEIEMLSNQLRKLTKMDVVLDQKHSIVTFKYNTLSALDEFIEMLMRSTHK